MVIPLEVEIYKYWHIYRIVTFLQLNLSHIHISTYTTSNLLATDANRKSYWNINVNNSAKSFLLLLNQPPEYRHIQLSMSVLVITHSCVFERKPKNENCNTFRKLFFFWKPYKSFPQFKGTFSRSYLQIIHIAKISRIPINKNVFFIWNQATVNQENLGARLVSFSLL